nr:hypothetical protein [Tanacetum cinerariifolium]
MTTPTVTSSTDSQMHNNIMAAGSKDRSPMLATGRYPQWRSRFLRYIDTRPNGEDLRKCILSGPYKPKTVLVQAVDATDDSPAIPEHTTEIWEAIKRLQQGESLNIQDVKTNLFWEFGKFTSHDGETMESYYTRFYKLMNEIIRNNLTVATMQVSIQFLLQLQPEWSRLRFVLDCVSSEDLAFCLQKILRFVFKRIAFCLQRYCVFPGKHCVLPKSRILRFVSEALRFA